MAYAVEVKNIVKKFPSVTAVDDVSFNVDEGEIFGLLGPNGAGKTTSGQANIRGLDVVKYPVRVRRNIGVVSQAMTSDLDLTAWENLDIYGKYFDIPKTRRHETIKYLLETVGLANRAQELVATYSGGMRRRLEIARGLIHKPYILFLDEPTTGLDPQSRRVIWDLLNKIRKETKLTIFITTHYMDEADFLCDRIAIVDYGKIVVLDSPSNLKRSIGGFDIIEMLLSNYTPEVEASLKAMQFVKNKTKKDEYTRVYVTDAAKAMPVIIEDIKKMHGSIDYLAIQKQSLEDVFIHYTGKTIREAEAQKTNFILGAGAPRQFPGGRL